MNQLGLDWTPPRTHTGDPASSHLAEARLRNSGRLNQQQQVVYEWVIVQPGSTASEISAHIAASPGAEIFAAGEHERLCQVRKRLSDLRAMEPKRVRRRYTPGENESRWFVA